MRTKFAPFGPSELPTLPASSTALLTVGLDRDRLAPAAYEAPTAVQASDPAAPGLDRREMVDAIDDLARRLAVASGPVSTAARGVLYGALAVGAFASWLFGVLVAVRHVVMWGAISVVFVVVGAYAAFCPPDRLPRCSLEIGPDPEALPLPPAPVGPVALDAAVVARRSR